MFNTFLSASNIGFVEPGGLNKVTRKNGLPAFSLYRLIPEFVSGVEKDTEEEKGGTIIGGGV